MSEGHEQEMRDRERAFLCSLVLLLAWDIPVAVSKMTNQLLMFHELWVDLYSLVRQIDFYGPAPLLLSPTIWYWGVGGEC